MYFDFLELLEWYDHLYVSPNPPTNIYIYVRLKNLVRMVSVLIIRLYKDILVKDP